VGTNAIIPFGHKGGSVSAIRRRGRSGFVLSEMIAHLRDLNRTGETVVVGMNKGVQRLRGKKGSLAFEPKGITPTWGSYDNCGERGGLTKKGEDRLENFRNSKTSFDDFIKSPQGGPVLMVKKAASKANCGVTNCQT